MRKIMFTNIDIKTVYHVSKNDFDFPDYEFTIGSVGQHHANSALGFWASHVPGSYNSFGLKCYSMKADPSSNIKLIPYDKFKELTCYKTPEEIIELRRQLLKDNVDILCVVDSDGPMRKLAEIIFINYEKIVDFTPTKIYDKSQYERIQWRVT